MSGFGCTDQSSAILIVETTYSGEDAASSSAAKVSYVDDPYTIAVTQPVTSSSGNPSLSSAVPSTSPTSTGSSATTHISSRTSPASKPTINSATSSSPTSGAVGPTTATASPLPTIIASSTPIGAIVGGVIGGLAVVGAIIGALVYMCLRHRRNRNNEGAVVGTSEHHQPYNDSKSPMVMAQHQPILAQEGGPGAVTYYSPPQNEKKFAQVQIQHSNSYASAGSGRSTYSPPISPSPQYVPLPSHSPAPQFLPGSPHSSSISPPISPPLQAEFVELGQYGTLGPSTHSPTAFEAPT
ncbi:MAG: hypothetical protein M1827_007163 [Pycnora praestabilis]|nr:MAG: hypothetical protein M1827_007163 [Pycnora praestabilis]